MTTPIRAMANALAPILEWAQEGESTIVTFESDGSSYRDPSNIYMSAESRPAMHDSSRAWRFTQLRSGRLGTMRSAITKIPTNTNTNTTEAV
jgi:hypothetical protein